MGLEPIPSPWQGEILPLNYTYMVAIDRIELPFQAYETRALPLNYIAVMVATARVELETPAYETG